MCITDICCVGAGFQILLDKALSWEALLAWMSTRTEITHSFIMGAQHLPVSGPHPGISEEPELPSRQIYVLWNY